MDIFITSSVGHGITKIAAFDAALRDAGIANTNLIVLSSVIPPNPHIKFGIPNIPKERFGDRLYVVKAENTTAVKGKSIASGIGWVMETNNAFGLFVEHMAETRGEVVDLIRCSLKDMTLGRSEYRFTQPKMKVEEAVCENQPVCCLVCAVYKLEKW